MIHNGQRVLVVIALAIVAASCGEPAAPPTTDPTTLALTPSFEIVEEGPQDPPPGTPPEYQWPTELDVDPSAAFVGNTASGESLVHYQGTHATADVTIDISRGATSYGTSHGESADSHILPVFQGTLSATAAKVLSGSCGFIVNATAKGSVKMVVPAIPPTPEYTFGSKKDTKHAAAEAPACPPPKARLTASYGGLSGNVLNLTIPEDHSIIVGLSASGSAPGDSGGPPISSYAWFANSASLGGGVRRWCVEESDVDQLQVP